ncbi:MAG TPA: tRNA preQ1(34) S-adenosylmethionine ribosyltransferase-isomerase QueA [candidate division Zixibacteria bacterium]|nr:tRNA preQ1(34) S-adenosylmethionine ribosyltransferase-isomerase QueA [candidate division Zixibacteria bacterium]
MNVDDLYYELPESLIAAYPTGERESARLMVVRRDRSELIHTVFASLGDFLDPGDLLVLNDTKVFPARLRGVKETGGAAEVLLLERFPDKRSLWMALIDSAKKPRVGSRIRFADDLAAEVLGDLGRGRFALEFHHSGDFAAQLEARGEPPLPPYITRRRAPAVLDRERYQTVYAANPGAIAAPTAGFHFTGKLFEQLAARGIGRALLTLHVGPGTFQPLRGGRLDSHRMEGERYRLGSEAAEAIRRVKQLGRRVVAVGSTTTRVLEWVVRQRGRIEADEGITRLFIRPGTPFLVVDALVTNFHLPGSTPLALVAAFAGIELVRQAYAEAVRLRYRFYSYGDAMLIL